MNGRRGFGTEIPKQREVRLATPEEIKAARRRYRKGWAIFWAAFILVVLAMSAWQSLVVEGRLWGPPPPAATRDGDNIPSDHCKTFDDAQAVHNGEYRGCSVPVDRGGRTEWVDNG